VGCGYGEISLLSWDELRLLRAEGVRLGSQSHTHGPFTDLSPADLVADLLESRAQLRRNLGETVEALVYPFDHDEIVHQMALPADSLAPFRARFVVQPTGLHAISAPGRDRRRRRSGNL
jgi:peptidoglycan/xylan/chitin deacetylase (PgdA/CDA1 family)